MPGFIDCNKVRNKWKSIPAYLKCFSVSFLLLKRMEYIPKLTDELLQIANYDLLTYEMKVLTFKVSGTASSSFYDYIKSRHLKIDLSDYFNAFPEKLFLN